MEKIGVLLMAYGGPDSLDDVEPYLLDVRGGRATSPALVEEIRERYARIGGKSPLLEITRRQAIALQAELNHRTPRNQEFATFVGMRHWTPRIAEAVRDMKAAGVHQAVALVMAPHYSRMSIEVYLNRLNQAIEDQQAGISITHVRSWHNHPGLIEAIAEHAQEKLDEFGHITPFVIFTAHSLPQRILENGDPYPDQLRETAEQVAARLDLPGSRWMFSYQSAGRTGEPWLGPQIEEVVSDLAGKGEKNLLVVPVGFVSDHVEVLYDIDIEARHAAGEHGARLERSRSLNDSPTFVRALADLVCSNLDGK